MMILACLNLCSVCPAYALSSSHGSIQIDVLVDDESGHKVGVKDVKFLLYHVADWDGHDWIYMPNFSDYRGGLDFTDAKTQEESADALCAYIKKKAFREVEGTSNAAGILVFNNLAEGVYLLAQENSFEFGNYIYTSKPSLVRIPSHMDDQDYLNVELEMKFARTAKPPLPPGPPSGPPTPPPTQPSVPEPTPTEPTSPTDPQPTSPEKPGPSGGGGSHTGPGPAETTRAGEEETMPALTETEVGVEEEETTAPQIIGVKTGDRAHPRLYLALMAISLIGMLVLGDVLRRMKRDEHEG